MTSAISLNHRNRFEEIKKNLSVLGCRESTFLKVELLFFEALDISRSYGDDPNQNELLAALKRVQSEAYERTKSHTKKSSQREQLIKKFMIELKRTISVK